MSNPKELLISTIKEWIDVNNELVKIQKIVKEHREKKKAFDRCIGRNYEK